MDVKNLRQVWIVFLCIFSCNFSEVNHYIFNFSFLNNPVQMLWTVLRCVPLLSLSFMWNKQNIEGDWFAACFKLFPVFRKLRWFYAFPHILLCRSFLVCYRFSATVIVYCKQLSSFTGFIFTFLLLIHLEEKCMIHHGWVLSHCIYNAFLKHNQK